jgi:hypothetical protein
MSIPSHYLAIDDSGAGGHHILRTIDLFDNYVRHNTILGTASSSGSQLAVTAIGDCGILKDSYFSSDCIHNLNSSGILMEQGYDITKN